MPSTFGSDGPAADLAAILAAAALGDGQAWTNLVGLYARRIFALARSRVGRPDLAEEITQSVFVTLASKLKAEASGYSEQGRFESWLMRIAMNRVRDEIRRQRRHAEPTDPEHLSNVPSTRDQQHEPTTNEDNDRQLRTLRSALSKLSDSDREIIEMRHHGGLSFAQIAELLSEPLGTLLARHHRALKKLKLLLEENAADRDSRKDDL
ncbi:MAG: sigma-70 family RNA polymerase sigma factor [Phycisphaerales bacterium]|nr:sigma-70 family RNA polymerase sigma factor [Phycisphaerales bacterium]